MGTIYISIFSIRTMKTIDFNTLKTELHIEDDF